MTIAGAGKPDGEDGAWVKVPVAPVRTLSPVTLKAIKAEPSLAKMELIRQSRLSVWPVREEEWAPVLEMADEDAVLHDRARWPRPRRPRSPAWHLTPDGYGPVRIGMTRAQVARALGAGSRARRSRTRMSASRWSARRAIPTSASCS